MEQATDRGGGADTGRSIRKRTAILEAARTAFLNNGYAGTSMDEVAVLAAVSKPTIYKNFGDKERLFTTIITGDIRRAEERSRALIEALPDSENLEEGLLRFARLHITVVTQRHLIQMRRLIIAEADRFPDVARTWYQAGPERAHTLLAERFQLIARQGRLRLDDPLLAAEHFNWLILSIPLNKAMFHGSDTQFSGTELRRYADEAVRVFLAAYGT